jgi:hypothetical protein
MLKQANNEALGRRDFFCRDYGIAPDRSWNLEIGFASAMKVRLESRLDVRYYSVGWVLAFGLELRGST